MEEVAQAGRLADGSIRIGLADDDDVPRPLPTCGLADLPRPALAFDSNAAAPGERPRLLAGGADARA